MSKKIEFVKNSFVINFTVFLPIFGKFFDHNFQNFENFKNKLTKYHANWRTTRPTYQKVGIRKIETFLKKLKKVDPISEINFPTKKLKIE